ncbi:protein CREG2-like [Carassius auratus]|uniref:Protein CREG2-like n=1 Tax=Carassius auratus TaxID=7957 RepID=A0A6P6KQN9_CARAU|nr:protein CREG2-like [Carassius auratus]XP_052461349.1 protein CREG2 [Carassius gibelio]
MLLLQLLQLVSALATLLCVSEGYTIRSAVSWAVSSDVVEEEELDTLSDEAPAVLGIWEQAYPSSVYRDASENKPEQISKSEDVSSASRVFSYRMEEVKVPSSIPPPPPPPPHEQAARAARYLARYSDWGHLATVSTQEQIKGLPFGNIFSVSDGPADNSTGVPYFYVTPMDDTVTDLRSFPFASLTFSEAEGDFCRKHVYDPEDPRCARLTLTGKMVEVGPEELDFAKEAMFSRHPVMKKWPPEHDWFFMKLVLQQVWLQHWVGGVSVVPLEEYFKATPF